MSRTNIKLFLTELETPELNITGTILGYSLLADYLTVFTSFGFLYHLNIKTSESTTIKITKELPAKCRCFVSVDFLGAHCVVSIPNAGSFYINTNTSTVLNINAKTQSKFLVSGCCWNVLNDSYDKTGSILLSTYEGYLLKASFDTSESVTVNVLANLNTPLFDLKFIQFLSNANNRYIIIFFRTDTVVYFKKMKIKQFYNKEPKISFNEFQFSVAIEKLNLSLCKVGGFIVHIASSLGLYSVYLKQNSPIEAAELQENINLISKVKGKNYSHFLCFDNFVLLIKHSENNISKTCVSMIEYKIPENDKVSELDTVEYTYTNNTNLLKAVIDEFNENLYLLNTTNLDLIKINAHNLNKYKKETFLSANNFVNALLYATTEEDEREVKYKESVYYLQRSEFLKAVKNLEFNPYNEQLVVEYGLVPYFLFINRHYKHLTNKDNKVQDNDLKQLIIKQIDILFQMNKDEKYSNVPSISEFVKEHTEAIIKHEIKKDILQLFYKYNRLEEKRTLLRTLGDYNEVIEEELDNGSYLECIDLIMEYLKAEGSSKEDKTKVIMMFFRSIKIDDILKAQNKIFELVRKLENKLELKYLFDILSILDYNSDFINSKKEKNAFKEQLIRLMIDKAKYIARLDRNNNTATENYYIDVIFVLAISTLTKIDKGVPRALGLLDDLDLYSNKQFVLLPLLYRAIELKDLNFVLKVLIKMERIENAINFEGSFKCLDLIKSELKGQGDFEFLFIKMIEENMSGEINDLIKDDDIKNSFGNMMYFLVRKNKLGFLKQSISELFAAYNKDLIEIEQEVTNEIEKGLLLKKEINILKKDSKTKEFKFKTKHCDFCNQNVFLDKFRVFNCGHKYHLDCENAQIEKSKMFICDDVYKAMETNKDNNCLICGNLMIESCKTGLELYGFDYLFDE
eukprot:GAHX01001472.1.p1 GENE.GAHX01001472.1~~GAHX01001472.1.p1  ORF type:complete len:912 (+),score=245.24 GAHX01001472.1:44-2779(+)